MPCTLSWYEVQRARISAMGTGVSKRRWERSRRLYAVLRIKAQGAGSPFWFLLQRRCGPARAWNAADLKSAARVDIS